MGNTPLDLVAAIPPPLSVAFISLIDLFIGKDILSLLLAAPLLYGFKLLCFPPSLLTNFGGETSPSNIFVLILLNGLIVRSLLFLFSAFLSNIIVEGSEYLVSSSVFFLAYF